MMRKFTSFGAIFLVMWIFLLVSFLDNNKKEQVQTKEEILAQALNNQLKAEAQGEAAQRYCGNAGWRISNDGKVLTCIPRHGKPYITTLSQ